MLNTGVKTEHRAKQLLYPIAELNEKSSKSELPAPGLQNSNGSQLLNMTESSETPKIYSKLKDFKSIKERKDKIENKKRDEQEEKKGRRQFVTFSSKGSEYQVRKTNDRFFRKYQGLYDKSVKRMWRNWAGLVYGVYTVRMNLVKFLLKNLPEVSEKDIQKEIVLENQTLYEIIRDAHNVSVEGSFLLWSQLRNLLINRMTLKNAIQTRKLKEPTLRDLKAAEAKLTEMKNEIQKFQENQVSSASGPKEEEVTLKEKLQSLEKEACSKDTRYRKLLKEISDLKKEGVQIRGRILMNMKRYKDMKRRRQRLVNVEEKIDRLRNEQSISFVEYSFKIENLKTEIEEMDRLIEEHKEEKKKLKANFQEMKNAF